MAPRPEQGTEPGLCRSRLSRLRARAFAPFLRLAGIAVRRHATQLSLVRCAATALPDACVELRSRRLVIFVCRSADRLAPEPARAPPSIRSAGVLLIRPAISHAARR